MEDRNITCADCGKSFVFTVSEQQFYKERGFENEPRRCKNCRDSRRSGRGGNRGMGGQRKFHEVTCADCGKVTQVPFKPTGEKPVYCRDCFGKYKSDQGQERHRD
ncbi:zinc-ribbon domain containing protein [bacterium]|nr:zinc-ribbon domain containing protein [bacterium]